MTLLSAPILPLPEPLSIADRFHLSPRISAEPPAGVRYLFGATQPFPGATWLVRWYTSTSCLSVARRDGDGPFEEIWRQEVKDESTPIESNPLYLNIIQQFAAFNDRCEKAAGHGALSRGTVWLKDGLVNFVRRPKAIRRGLWVLVKWFLIFMGVLLCFTLLMQSLFGFKGPVSPRAASAAVAGNQVPPELRDRSLGDSLTTTEMQVVADATRQLGVQMRPTGQPFVVFSDPNCPACKDLETKLSQVDPRFVPVIVPVSFKPGSDELVKRVFCAKDTVAAWSVAVGGHEATGDAASDGSCPEAAHKALSANAAFTALNFSATPTIVSATGKVVAGSGSIEGINKWLIANGGLVQKQ